MAENDGLTFCSTKELIDELYKRHDSLVIAGIKFTKVDGSFEVTRFHKGHNIVCLGLIDNMTTLINADLNSKLEPSK